MKTTLQAAIAALLIAGISPAHAQIMGDENTSVTGDTIYIEEDTVVYEQQAGFNGHDSLTISGAVGMPLNPTAHSLPKGKVRVQVNYFDLFDSGVSDAKLYGIYAAARIGDSPLEVSYGIGKLNSDNDVLHINTTDVAVGVKYVMTADDSDPEAIRFAIGAGYDGALYDNKHVYAVATKSFGAGTRVVSGHLGVRYDRFSILDEDSSKVSFYGGVEVPIDRRGHFNLVGEVQSKNASEELGGKAPYSLSLRYQNENGFAASAGLARQGVLADFAEGGSRRFFVQLGKTF